MIPSLLGLVSIAARAAAQTSPFPVALCNGIDIEDKKITVLQQYLTDGNLTSKALTQCYVARIEQTASYLNSISEVNPDALSIAAAMDEERARGNVRGPLHGIPFLSKDNIYTDDKHNTSEGTLVLLGGRYSQEATIIQRVRAAGGVLLGHSAMSEAADHRALVGGPGGGYSSRTGRCRNPYNLTQSTSGSSSGSAVAVRDNQCAIALGTETHGSLVHPAANLGLYTLKSTPGLQSRHGIVTGSFYHDTPGSLARSVADVAIMLDIMVGADPLDNLTLEAVPHYPKDGYLAEVVSKDSLKGMKLGVPWYYWNASAPVNTPGQRELYEGRIAELKAAGAEIYNVTTAQMTGIETIASPYGFGQPADTPDEFSQLIAYNTLMDVGYASYLQNWTFPKDDDRYGMSTLAQMAAWNDAHNATTGALGNGTIWTNPTSGQDFYDNAIATNGTLGATFWGAFGWGRLTARAAIDGGLSHTLENGTTIALDALLVPNSPVGGFDDPCSSIPSYAGYPVASVPIGSSGYSLPAGICIYGSRWGEAKLIRVASALEDLFQWNEKPLYWNYEVGKDRSYAKIDAHYPGYACTEESLQRYACDAPAADAA